MLTDRPLRLGLLGCADIATRRMLPAVAAAPGVTLVAVASRSFARAAAVAGQFGAEPVEGYERLLARDDVAAVYLPLPPGLHAHWAERALRAGKHVLVEKPLTTRLTDTLALVEAARAANLVLRENFLFPHHSQHRFVQKLLAGGAIGALRSFSAGFAVPPRRPDDIRYRPELGGGALFDVGVYPLRAAQLFLGPELATVGGALRYHDTYGVDVGGAVLLQRPDGVTAALEFGLEHHYTSRYQLLGAAGRISVEHAFTPPAEHRPVVRVERQDHREEHILPADDQCGNAVAAFVGAVRDAAVVNDSAVAQAELLERSRRAAQPPAPERPVSESNGTCDG